MPQSIRLAPRFLGAACIAALIVAGCGGNAPEKQPVVEVQATTVARKNIQQVISAEAELYARSIATIVPKISAPVVKFYANRGSHVRKGQLIAQLENKDLTAAADQAKGAYEQAQATYAASTPEGVPQQLQQAQLDVSATKQAADAERAVYESRKKLYQQGAISRNLLNDAEVASTKAENDYQLALARLKGLQADGQDQAMKLAQGQLATAKGQYEAALANLQYSEIRSPIDGVVTDRPLYEGQMAAAGQPLFTIMDLSSIVARAYIPPQQAAMLKVGDSASILPGNGAEPIPGKVSVVSPALDPNSTTVQVWVEAPNPGERIKPGLTVQVSMVAQNVKDALVVPSAAVLTAEDGSTNVMVIGSDNHAHQTAVKTGIHSGDDVQILSGLQAGQKVVTTGAYGLPDGVEVRVAAPAKEGGASD